MTRHPDHGKMMLAHCCSRRIASNSTSAAKPDNLPAINSGTAMPTLCRSCDAISGGSPGPCPRCGARLSVSHPELLTLAIAHVDCDAFYASIEKRDHPEWASRPLIVGGGKRGVVSTACYIARLSGVRSAMPMFKAIKLCPQALVIPPNMAKYAANPGASAR